jgi:hypothetical protein
MVSPKFLEGPRACYSKQVHAAIYPDYAAPINLKKRRDTLCITLQKIYIRSVSWLKSAGVFIPLWSCAQVPEASGRDAA